MLHLAKPLKLSKNAIKMLPEIIQSALLLSVMVTSAEWVEVIMKKSSSELVKTVTAPTYESALMKPLYQNDTRKTTEPLDEGEEDEVDVEDEEVVQDGEDEENEEDISVEVPQPLGLMSVVKHVQDQLMDFKGRTLEAKIRRLKHLSYAMLYEIKSRVTKLFTLQATQSNARGYEEHQMDYPSNEGALMTIGFLTFAVFLIKLVLKLIYALKMKQQYYQTTTPASIFLRETTDQDKMDKTARIMRYLDEYTP